MKCRDHGREPCSVPRCQVLAQCALSVPSLAFEGVRAEWKWYRQHGYKRFLVDHALGPAMIADRLVAWMRWRGKRRAGACARSRFTATHMLSVRPGIDDHWDDHGPGFWHPLNDCRPYHDRLRALASACPVCHRWGVHQRSAPLRTPPDPCDHDGIDWATVLVFLDWLHDRGWTLQEVHEWRPQRKEDP